MVFRPDAMSSESFKKYFVETPQTQARLIQLLHQAAVDRGAIDAETADQPLKTIETEDAVAMGRTKKRLWSGDPLSQWCDEMYERYKREQEALRQIARNPRSNNFERTLAAKQIDSPMLNQGAFAYAAARTLNNGRAQAKQRNNEDVVGIHRNGYILGDGLSGAGKYNMAFVGLRAIDVVVEPIFDALTQQMASAQEIQQVLLRVPQWARIQLSKTIQRHPDRAVQVLGGHKSGMSSTLEMVFYAPWLRQAFVAHVGDSRTHLLRGGFAQQITTDHKRPNILNLLTQTISMQNERRKIGVHQYAVSEYDVQEGDVFQSDTDGMFTERDLLAAEGNLPESFADFLATLEREPLSDEERIAGVFDDAAEQQFQVGHFDDRATARLRIKRTKPTV